jgi:hypothetical protein
MNKYVRLREASERVGFHPLETLRAGGSVDARAAPRLLTSLSAYNAFDLLEDEISGEGAKERRRMEVEDEIRERELERLKQSVVAGVRTTPTLATNRPPRIISTDQGPVPLSDITRPTPETKDGRIDTAIDDGGTGTTIRPRDRVVLEDGSTIDITVGPDVDEALTGAALESIGTGRQIFNRMRYGNPDRKAMESRLQMSVDPDKPIAWDQRFGGRQPDGWSTWTNEQKIRYITQNARSRK